ncbi:hypothetical protein [Marinobacter xestospongiae]|uniref:Uncharacterized protein n=1 Tax=Marinobacter xestospongiae TaxID=994319 RepID=A0ABU3W1J4_9GAMM|nr:hypothetical protein [Marinobacter xestospongiae]MDV2080379.1 hypothetical protein [Marinobacter xestospongiae]
MFVTQNHTEELIGRPFGREQFWSRVELSYDDIWFYVSTRYSVALGKARRYYLLTKPSDLVALIEETGDSFWIERVMIMTPPWVNGTECWKMSPLKELIAASDAFDLLNVDYIFQLPNDLCYATGDISEIDKLPWHQTLYSEERHACPDSISR